jgi:hypothetical protein
MTESVFETLTPITMTREVETNAKIVILMNHGLAETKHCRNKVKTHFVRRISICHSGHGGITGNTLQKRPFSRHQVVTQQSGRGYVRTHVPRVDTGC